MSFQPYVPEKTGMRELTLKAVLIGLPWMQDGYCHNGYALLDGGRIAAVRLKVDLPNYGVFDDKLLKILKKE